MVKKLKSKSQLPLYFSPTNDHIPWYIYSHQWFGFERSVEDKTTAEACFYIIEASYDVQVYKIAHN